MSESAPTVVLTGIAGGLAGLGASLASAGFRVVELPLLYPDESEIALELRRACRALHRYGAIAVTSPRAAFPLADVLSSLHPAPSSVPPVWCGEASATVLRDRLPSVSVPPAAQDPSLGLGLRLANAMVAAGVSGPVLFPCGTPRRPDLELRLRAAGRRVDPVEAYRVHLAQADVARRALTEADILVVTSPRVAELLAAQPCPAGRPMLVAIGSTTAGAARRAGWIPDGTAPAPTVEALRSVFSCLSPTSP